MLTLMPDAEVVVIYGNPEASVDEDNPWDWNCGQGSGALYVNNCDLEAFNLYIEHLNAIYQKIHELRDGQPTIIRAYDAYNPVIPNRVGADGYGECMTCWQTFNEAIHLAADQNNIPIGLVAEAWNGPDFLLNPVEMGYTKDDIHPSELGAQVIAQALRELGYEPVEP
jgi:lysophospholipase L1-like esterase